MAHDVFISYSQRDKPTADAAHGALESAGIRCWIAPRDVPRGMSRPDAIVGAISQSRVMVVVFSSHAADSDEVQHEVVHAFQSLIVIVLLRIEDVRPSGTVSYCVSRPYWLDAITPPLTEHLGTLTEMITALLPRTSENQRKPNNAAHESNPTLPSERPVLVRARRTRPSKWIIGLAGSVLVMIALAVALSVTRGNHDRASWTLLGNSAAEIASSGPSNSRKSSPTSTKPATHDSNPPLPSNKAGEPSTVKPRLAAEEPKSITNSIGMKLVLIPAGEFMMGSPNLDSVACGDEKPRHRVRITRPFYLGMHEVTQAQYQAVMGANPSHFCANGGGRDKVNGESTAQHPVERVSWLDGVTFCNKLSEKEGRRAFYEVDGEKVSVPDWNCAGYRLPTEAEWEYACRANSATRYSFGDAAASLGGFGWFESNSENKTHPVGKKRSNGFGLFDMHGNVWEWCWDGYGEYSNMDSPIEDPAGIEIAGVRVDRGGSWDDNPRTRVRRSVSRTFRASGTTTWACAWPSFSLSADI